MPRISIIVAPAIGPTDGMRLLSATLLVYLNAVLTARAVEPHLDMLEMSEQKLTEMTSTAA